MKRSAVHPPGRRETYIHTKLAAEDLVRAAEILLRLSRPEVISPPASTVIRQARNLDRLLPPA